jgi:hypothetical protein
MSYVINAMYPSLSGGLLRLKSLWKPYQSRIIDCGLLLLRPWPNVLAQCSTPVELYHVAPPHHLAPDDLVQQSLFEHLYLILYPVFAAVIMCFDLVPLS